MSVVALLTLLLAGLFCLAAKHYAACMLCWAVATLTFWVGYRIERYQDQRCLNK